MCHMAPSLYRDSVLAKLPQLLVLDGVRVNATTEFYTAVREPFEMEPALFTDTPPWSQSVQWNDIPIYVPVQLDTTAFYANAAECKELLTCADAELQKWNEMLKATNET